MLYEVLKKKWNKETGAFCPVIEISSEDGSWRSGPIDGRELSLADGADDELKIHQWLAGIAMQHAPVAAQAAAVAAAAKPKVKRGLIDATKLDKARKVGEGKTGSIPDTADDEAPAG